MWYCCHLIPMFVHRILVLVFLNMILHVFHLFSENKTFLKLALQLLQSTVKPTNLISSVSCTKRIIPGAGEEIYEVAERASGVIGQFCVSTFKYAYNLPGKLFAVHW